MFAFTLYYVVFFGLLLAAVFWVLRLAVRYGTNDALRMNREWLAPGREQDVVPHEARRSSD